MILTPILDVPVATYYTRSKPADGKSGSLCDTQGYKVPFEKEKIIAPYPTLESYLDKVSQRIDSMVKARFLRKGDGEKIKREAEKLSAW